MYTSFHFHFYFQLFPKNSSTSKYFQVILNFSKYFHKIKNTTNKKKNEYLSVSVIKLKSYSQGETVCQVSAFKLKKFADKKNCQVTKIWIYHTFWFPESFFSPVMAITSFYKIKIIPLRENFMLFYFLLTAILQVYWDIYIIVEGCG